MRSSAAWASAFCSMSAALLAGRRGPFCNGPEGHNVLLIQSGGG